jgi:transposase
VKTVEAIREQIRAVDKELQEDFAQCVLKEETHRDDDVVPVSNPVMLNQLVGIGRYGATVLSRELFDWRDFQNRRQVAGCVGLVPVPHLSGAGGHDQGISKAGNARVRKLLVEQAWSWLRYQPESALTRWFNEKFGRGKRNRRVGIVALARRLVVAMWRYLKHGVVPEGALLRAVG